MKIIKTLLLLCVAVAVVLAAVALYHNKGAREKIKSSTEETVSDVVQAGERTADKLATNAERIATNVTAKVKVAASNAVDKAADLTTNIMDGARQELEGGSH